MGAFCSTKNSENFETGSNGAEISWQIFQKFKKLLNFRNANHSNENSGLEIEGAFHSNKNFGKNFIWGGEWNGNYLE